MTPNGTYIFSMAGFNIQSAMAKDQPVALAGTMTFDSGGSVSGYGRLLGGQIEAEGQIRGTWRLHMQGSNPTGAVILTIGMSHESNMEFKAFFTPDGAEGSIIRQIPLHKPLTGWIRRGGMAT